MLVHTQSPDLVDPNPNYNGDSDTALIDMHPTAGFPLEPVDERRHDRRSGLRRPVRGISIQNMAQSASGATLAITMPADTHATQPSGPR